MEEASRWPDSNGLVLRLFPAQAEPTKDGLSQANAGFGYEVPV